MRWHAFNIHTHTHTCTQTRITNPRTDVQVVIVVVAEEDEVNGRELAQRVGRGEGPAGARELDGGAAVWGLGGGVCLGFGDVSGGLRG